jgi:hypothetical protein
VPKFANPTQQKISPESINIFQNIFIAPRENLIISQLFKQILTINRNKNKLMVLFF